MTCKSIIYKKSLVYYFIKKGSDFVGKFFFFDLYATHNLIQSDYVQRIKHACTLPFRGTPPENFGHLYFIYFMPRPSLLKPGVTVAGYRVLTLFPAEKGKTRRVSLECVVCTARRESWTNLLLSGRLTCRTCNPPAASPASFTPSLPPAPTPPGYIVLQAGNLVLTDEPPSEGWVWVSASKAVPFASATPVPERLPDPRWPVHFIIPVLYLPFCLGEPCSEALHAPALAYLESRLDGAYEEFTAGSTKSWYDEHGNEVCYLYAVNSDAKVKTMEGPSCTL